MLMFNIFGNKKNMIIVKNNSYEFYNHVKYSRQASGKKGRSLLLSLEKSRNCIINRNYSLNRNKIGGYRFLNNPRITEQSLLDGLKEQCKKNCKGLHVIGIQDTTEYNYQHHVNRLKEGTLGVIGNDSDHGYFAHLMITFNAENCLPQGISYCRLWSREPQHKKRSERQYKKLPIEEKESYRWIEAAEQTKSLLKEANHITLISDRESDIYQCWDRIPDDKTDLIIRAHTDRSLFNQSSTVYQVLEKQEIAGSYSVKLKGDKRANQSKRTALLNIKYVEVQIKKPESVRGDPSAEDHITLMVVEAREDNSTVKKNESPIHWVLFTTYAVEDFEQACLIIDWYGFRWQIEQFIRITKSQGLDLENSQLETGQGLKNLALLAFASSLTILQMSLARDGRVNDDVKKYFSKQDIIVLGLLNDQLKGTTKKQQNPFPRQTLAWATWLIARLGGYGGYSSQSPPGPKTFIWGLQKLFQIKIGYYLSQKDVYKE
jgi:hypothetical protein